MSLNKHLAGAVIAAAVLVIGTSAEAKGPQGVGAAASSSNSASSSSQGNGKIYRLASTARAKPADGTVIHFLRGFKSLAKPRASLGVLP